jgi:hypothetical protein
MRAGRAVVCCKLARTSIATGRKQSASRVEAQHEVRVQVQPLWIRRRAVPSARSACWDHDAGGGCAGPCCGIWHSCAPKADDNRRQALECHQVPRRGCGTRQGGVPQVCSLAWDKASTWRDGSFEGRGERGGGGSTVQVPSAHQGDQRRPQRGQSEMRGSSPPHGRPARK